MVKWLLLGLLMLPALEIGVFVLVALAIGFAKAMGISLATSVLGFLILRGAGRGRLGRLREAVSKQDAAGFQANAGGLVTVLAGVLLLLPGFLTDVAGAVLLIPPLRRGLSRLAKRAMPAQARSRKTVIDLSPDEWRQVPPPEIDPPLRGPDPVEPIAPPERTPDRTAPR